MQTELETKTQEEPIYKIELEKNVKNKKRLVGLEEDFMRFSTEVEELEEVNKYLVEKKERMIQERKKFIQSNEDLKREIESKVKKSLTRINLMR